MLLNYKTNWMLNIFSKNTITVAILAQVELKLTIVPEGDFE